MGFFQFLKVAADALTALAAAATSVAADFKRAVDFVDPKITGIVVEPAAPTNN